MTKLLHQEVTRSIIGAAFEVHKILGSGFLESVYEAALVHEFDLRKINYRRQQPLEVAYKDQCVGRYIPDFTVSDCVIVELKATKGLKAIDEAQLINYLKATRYRVGLLLNIGLFSLQFKRRVV